MRWGIIGVIIVLGAALASPAGSGTAIVTFDQLFPTLQQREMGLHKLNPSEKEALRTHVEALLVAAFSSATGGESGSGGGEYAGVGGGHWIKKNVDSGTYIILEDGSMWQIDPYNKIDAMLWLAISDITVIESSSGSPGYDYLLVNTDDGEQAHAKYVGQQ